MNREETIKGLETLKENIPIIIAYGYGDLERDAVAIVSDALELLKEQEPAKVRHLHGTKVTVHEEIVFTDECENCSGYLLKHWKACPICGKLVIWE